MAKRDKDQADFDLEKMFELLDEALTSKDERVQSALRGLLTIIALTRTQDDDKMLVETNHGPLRRMQEDLKDISRRMWNIQEEVRQLQQKQYPNGGVPINPSPYGGQPYTNPGSPYQAPSSPFYPPYTTTYTTSGTGGLATQSGPQLWNQK